MVTRCYKNLAMMLPHLYSGQNTVVYKLINEPYGPYPICKGFTLPGHLLGLPHWATWNHPLDCYIRTTRVMDWFVEVKTCTIEPGFPVNFGCQVGLVNMGDSCTRGFQSTFF